MKTKFKLNAIIKKTNNIFDCPRCEVERKRREGRIKFKKERKGIKKKPLKNLLFFPNLLKIFPVPIIVPKISKEGESCYGNYSPLLPPQRTHL